MGKSKELLICRKGSDWRVICQLRAHIEGYTLNQNLNPNTFEECLLRFDRTRERQHVLDQYVDVFCSMYGV